MPKNKYEEEGEKLPEEEEVVDEEAVDEEDFDGDDPVNSDEDY